MDFSSVPNILNTDTYDQWFWDLKMHLGVTPCHCGAGYKTCTLQYIRKHFELQLVLCPPHKDQWRSSHQQEVVVQVTLHPHEYTLNGVWQVIAKHVIVNGPGQ